MISVVKLRKSQLDYFRHLARNSTKEIHAYLIGSIISPQLVRIEHFVYAEYKEQTNCSVLPTAKDEQKIARWTLDKGLQIVGTIHSHPNWDCVLSPSDYEGHITDGNRISGVVSVMERKTRVRFWLAESSLPCKITYIEEE